MNDLRATLLTIELLDARGFVAPMATRMQMLGSLSQSTLEARAG